jgi:hypothetical protein
MFFLVMLHLSMSQTLLKTLMLRTLLPVKVVIVECINGDDGVHGGGEDRE